MGDLIKNLLREELEDKMPKYEIKSYTHWKQIHNNQTNRSVRKIIADILLFAENNRNLVTRRQMAFLNDAKMGRANPKSYHTKN